MKVEMTNGQLLAALEGLEAIGVQPAPVNLQIKVRRNVRRLADERATLYDLRKDVQEKYGKKDETGKVVRRPDGGVSEWEDEESADWEWKGLLEGRVEVEVDVITLDELQSSPLMVRAADLEAMIEAGVVRDDRPVLRVVKGGQGKRRRKGQG